MNGFTGTQIIEIAAKRTERRAAALDQKTEFLLALQSVCKRRRWWWRRIVKTFSVQAGVSRYDLATLANENGETFDDIHQVAARGLKVYIDGANYVCPEPVFDMEDQEVIRVLQASKPADKPQRYFIQGTPGTLFLDPIPNGNYTASIAYWSMPNIAPDKVDELITVVPHYMHDMIIKQLEAQFNAYSLGEGSAKYTANLAELDRMEQAAALYRNFAEGQIRELKFNGTDDSVRST